MSQSTKQAPRSTLAEVAASAVPDLVPLTKSLRERGIPRSTFYRHTEIPRITVKGRAFVSKAALDAFASQRAGEA